MYTYFDPNYAQAILALRAFHMKRLFVKRGAGALVFLIFVVVIALMLWNEGPWVYSSIPLAAGITYGYYLYLIYAMKKKGRHEKLVRSLQIEFQENQMQITSHLYSNVANKTALSYQDIAYGIETKENLFLYKDKTVALSIDKKRLEAATIAFLKKKVVIK